MDLHCLVSTYLILPSLSSNIQSIDKEGHSLQLSRANIKQDFLSYWYK